MARLIIGVVTAVREGRFLYLLLTLLLYLLGAPFLASTLRLRLLYYLFLTVVLLASLFAVRTHRIQTLIALILAIPMVCLVWLAYAHPWPVWILSANLISLLFLTTITVSILHFVFTTREVTQHVIFGAVSAYLLMGITWSILYALLEHFSPGAFSSAPAPADAQPGYFIYFSFVTLTTLGYGDITPITPKAQALVIGEAIVGQIYMAVLMAWLVGLYVSRKVAEKHPDL
jgi:voltage-gated potassium channel Kch